MDDCTVNREDGGPEGTANVWVNPTPTACAAAGKRPPAAHVSAAEQRGTAYAGAPTWFGHERAIVKA